MVDVLPHPEQTQSGLLNDVVDQARGYSTPREGAFESPRKFRPLLFERTYARAVHSSLSRDLTDTAALYYSDTPRW